MLTIFTPSYNRAYILSNLYRSLLTQTSYDFEWIIVDDASSDNTRELASSFKTDKFPIRYFLQEHGGKHRAINLAVRKARGNIFFIVDSDDYLLPDAVENIISWTKNLPDKSFCGVSGLKCTKNGKIIGGNVTFQNKSTYVDASNLERNKYGLYGDKAEVYFTDILRKYPFPEFEGEYFVTEGCVWDAIAADGYKIRWFNKPIYVCEYLNDGLTNTGANELEGSIKNFKGYLYFISQYLRLHDKIECYGRFIQYNKVCKRRDIPYLKRGKYIGFSVKKYIKYTLESTIYRIVKKIKNTYKKN